jgi:hypothetical protein
MVRQSYILPPHPLLLASITLFSLLLLLSSVPNKEELSQEKYRTKNPGISSTIFPKNNWSKYYKNEKIENKTKKNRKRGTKKTFLRYRSGNNRSFK